MIAIIMFLVVFMILEAETDLYVIDNWISPNHPLNAVIRVGVGVALLYSVSDSLKETFYYTWIYLSLWWIFFDLYLNFRRKLPLLYVGKTAYMDKVLWGLSEQTHININIVLVLYKLLILNIGVWLVCRG